VYLAQQESLGRRVAIKLMRPGIHQTEVARQRFEREAQAVARLHHPHIVTVFEAGEQDGMAFLAMEYIEGRGLDELLKDDRGSLGFHDSVRIAREVASALGSAHAAGLVHRDVKPSNIRITPDGQAKLLDFGLARSTRSSCVRRRRRAVSTRGSHGTWRP
jgi:serine/threonine-protein kinase